MLSDYALDRPIGRGGMAEVYLAHVKKGPHAGQAVAVKRMLPELAEDAEYVDFFLSEADITRQLQHPNIVQVLETGTVGDGFYMVMEYVDGRDLGAVMQQCAAREILLPVDFACFVAHTLAGALDYAHHATSPTGEPMGIVHCDVTPSNVFISSLGEIKLGDFGVARVGNFGAPAAGDAVAGKAHFLAPEQILGEPVSPATDVFALGAIFYELLTNSRAYSGASVQKVWEKICDGKIQPPRELRPQISAELEALVLRALAPHRSGSGSGIGGWLGHLRRGRVTRYAAAAELATDLEPLYDDAIGTPLAIASVVRGLFR